MIRAIKQNFTDRQAASGIARLLSGELSDREQVEMLSRQSSDDSYRNSFIDTMQTLSDMEDLAADPDILGVVAEDSPPRLQPSRNWRGWAVAAGLLLAVTAGYIGWTPLVTKDGDVQRYVTRIGEQKTVNLADGSAITLNTGTQILVEMSDQSRRIILERGEAYFDVARDPLRPFAVALGSRAISVLGTEFNIRKSPDSFVLAVVEGVVAIHGNEEQASDSAPAVNVDDGERKQYRGSVQRKVLAGTVAEYSENSQQLVAYRDAHIDRLHSWRTGLVRFDAVPLHKVIQELNRYSAKKILVEDSSVMDMEVYAGIRVDQANMALTLLEESLPIRVVRHFDRVVIVGEDSESQK
ncbi:FecR family protein [Porticoccus sp. GXU_MW_L64]